MSLLAVAHALGSWRFRAAMLVPVLAVGALMGLAAQGGGHAGDNPNMDASGNLMTCPAIPNGWECRASGGTCGAGYATWTLDWVNTDKNGNPRCVPPTPTASATGG